ncbi:Anthocyanin 5-aromatic acyltransferase [Morus notabilis]|uniref:Anthocyanin 5-aromatic acyltransferase n=1 Tax=Morus notabilis TaxID=981085 RepID=W9QIR3_9ROSA|nr:phenolic glucoside malonyltransferase 1 [Morus notabilis]EXB38111.1 Anthocyanin 5-aromatic acyltransferase [Morus notabilis]
MAKTLEITHVYPSTDSSNSLSDFSLPLTFCDTLWFKAYPVERLFFYSLPQPKQTFLNSTIPKLKNSLSQTLQHFLPLAGNLTWPIDSSKPIILYTPNDGVSLTVAESNAANKDEDFDFLSGKQARKPASFHPLVPKLKVSETGASVISLQITLFPNRGICIGVTCHHAVLDGKSTTMFMKSWAYFCRSEKQDLSPELTPFYDRSVIMDPDGLDMLYLNHWLALSKMSDPRDDPNLFQFFPTSELSSNLVRGTFELTKSDIVKLRQKVLSTWEKLEPTIRATKPHLSSFVVTFAYALVCILKVDIEEDEETNKKKTVFGFTADLRSRLKPPVPENYFGNCVGALASFEDARELLKEEDAFAAAAVKTGELIKELEEKDVMEGAREILARMVSGLLEGARAVGVAGSPRFGVYGTDFGWGKPKKVEIVSVDRTGAIAMAESRDGNGGIEIGVVLNKHEMDVFSSLFLSGVKSA